MGIGDVCADRNHVLRVRSPLGKDHEPMTPYGSCHRNDISGARSGIAWAVRMTKESVPGVTAIERTPWWRRLMVAIAVINVVLGLVSIGAIVLGAPGDPFRGVLSIGTGVMTYWWFR